MLRHVCSVLLFLYEVVFMKILYGVQGTGNGHITRARVMAKAFALEDDIQVDFIFSGREPNKYFDMEIFGDYRTFQGLSFVTENGSVRKWKTLKSAKLVQLYQDVMKLDLRNYDLVLNDFEPVSAWAAQKSNTPSISVSHQAAFGYNVPKKNEHIFDRLLTKYFAPCTIQLGVHWFHFGHPIIPPFIEEKAIPNPSNDHVLVYLPFENLDEIAALLAPFKTTSFLCFHPEIKNQYKNKNVSWYPPSKSMFKHALINCSGVIANGGFELSSECLQLGKKLLIKPLAGQYEQASNMLTLQQLGLCSSMQTLEPTAVDTWLSNPNPVAIQFPDNPQDFIDWLMAEDWHDTDSLCRTLWQKVQFPPALKMRLEQYSTSY